jgi:hypothetical protein
MSIMLLANFYYKFDFNFCLPDIIAMAEAKSHPIRNSVISGLIVAIIIGACSYIPGLWRMVYEIIQSVWDWHIERHELSGFFITLLGVFAITGVISILFFIWYLFISQPVKGPSDYTSDYFDGLYWRWKHANWGIYDLVCFCPNCDQQLRMHDRDTSFYHSCIGFDCDNCGYKSKDFEMRIEELEDKIKRSIQRKLRNGEWAKVVQSSDVSQDRN